MSWNIVSKEEAQELGGVSRKALRDEWSDMVEDLICDYVGYDYIGTTELVTDEAHDGSGTPVLFVDRPPIVSVSEVKIGGTTLSSSAYRVYDHFIQLVGGGQSRISKAIDGPLNVFPVGQQNIEIAYTSGLAEVPGKMKLAAAQMITEIAHYQKRGAAQGSVKYVPPERTDGEERSMQQRYGLSGALYMIMRETLDKKDIRIA